MPGQGLVAVQKEITSATGATFMRTYWVKPEDVAKMEAEGGKVTGEKKLFSELTPEEKLEKHKEKAAKAAATKKAKKEAQANGEPTAPAAPAPKGEPKPEEPKTNVSDGSSLEEMDKSLDADPEVAKQQVLAEVDAYAAKKEKWKAAAAKAAATKKAKKDGAVANPNASAEKAIADVEKSAAKVAAAHEKVAAAKAKYEAIKAKNAEANKAAADKKKGGSEAIDGNAELDKILGKKPEQTKPAEPDKPAPSPAKKEGNTTWPPPYGQKMVTPENSAELKEHVTSAMKKFGAFNVGMFSKGFDDAEMKSKFGDEWKDKTALIAGAEKSKIAAEKAKEKEAIDAKLPKNETVKLSKDAEKKRAALQTATKSGGISAGMKAAGATPKQIKMMEHHISAWSSSANNPDSMRLRGAAAKLVGESRNDGGAGLHAQFKNDKNASGSHGASDYSKQSMDSGFDDPELVDAVRKSSEVAQSMYDEEYITVYRGIAGDSASKIKSSAKKGDAVDFPASALSCWTESHSVAQNFGSSGVVVSMRVHRSSIAASHRVAGTTLNKGSYSHEQEVIIASTGKVRAVVM